jgi:hypothetical protein
MDPFSRRSAQPDVDDHASIVLLSHHCQTGTHLHVIAMHDQLPHYFTFLPQFNQVT